MQMGMFVTLKEACCRLHVTKLQGLPRFARYGLSRVEIAAYIFYSM